MKIGEFIKSWKAILVFVILALGIGLGMHTHTDEFILFSNLEYEQPNFYLNEFTNGYQAFIKIFPGNFQVHLPFNYLGNIQGILFYPFYKLLPIEIAKFCYSFLSLICLFLLLIQGFKLKGEKLWILLLFIPLYITILHDSGPVNLALLSYLISKILVEKYVQSEKWTQRFFALAALGLTWIIGFYDKQFYLYLFPSILLFSIANVEFNRLFTLKTLGLIAPVILFFGFVLMYLWTDTQIQIYHLEESFPFRLQTQKILGGTTDMQVFIDMIRYFPNQIHDWPETHAFFEDRLFAIGRWMNNFNFSFYLERNLDYTYFINPKFGSRLPISFFLFLIFLGSLCFQYLRKLFARGINKSELKPILYFLSFLVLSLTFFVLGKVRAPHHFIFLWIPLLGFLLDNDFQIQRKNSFLLFFGVSMGLCLLNWVIGKPNALIRDDYETVARLTQRENKDLRIINFDGWNHSITRKLDNPNHHLVTLVDPRNKSQFMRLVRLAKKLQIPIIEVSNEVDWGYPDPMTPEKKMDLFRAQGFKVKRLNDSKSIPVYLLTLDK